MDCCSNHQEYGHDNSPAGHDHSGHSGGHGMGHGSAASYLRRFWVVTFLLVPLVFAHSGLTDWLGLPMVPYARLVGFGLSTVIAAFSLVFFEHAWHEIKARQYGMMTLVSLAVAAGYLFSVASTFIPALETEFYLEISTLVWVLLFGHYLEAKSSSAAGNALQEVAKLLPKQAHKLVDGQEQDVDIAQLQTGDQVVVKPGEKVPADGTIVSGSANTDESLISGESKPIEKTVGQAVVAGSICLDGSLTVELNRVGENSTIGQIQKLIEAAGRSKPRSQRLADKASAVLTFAAGAVALATLAVWTLIIGESFVFAVTLAITVLVIACPHALGLAIPTVTTITTALAVRHGFFIKDLSKIEVIRGTDLVVFDKTGTLSKGEFGVDGITAAEGTEETEVLAVAASLERHSSHMIGYSILRYAESQGVELRPITNFQNHAGQGISAEIDGQEYFAGNAGLMEELGLDAGNPDSRAGTVVFVATRQKRLGAIVLADSIKDSSYQAVKRLHSMGIKVAMLTGDNQAVAKTVSEELHIDTYFAEVRPEEKYKYIKQLQGQGNRVLMVGDGVNDAPALTQADAGVAIGAGTEVAVEAGDVVLTDSDPEDIVRLIELSKKVYVKMVQNLIWALGYNVVAIPAAAGVFAVWGFFLRPEIGALIMSLSTVIVVLNALTLKRVELD